MNRTYAYLRNDRKIKFRMVSAQHLINEAPETPCNVNQPRLKRATFHRGLLLVTFNVVFLFHGTIAKVYTPKKPIKHAHVKEVMWCFFLKIIILCIWCNRICWHALIFNKTHYFSNNVHYCRSSMPCLSPSDKRSLLWLANWHSALWLAEHHKHSSEM